MNRKFLLLLIGFCMSSIVHANIVGTNIQNFNPTADGVGFVTVHSPQTLDPGYVNFGLFLNLASNSLPSFVDSSGERLNSDDRLMYADLHFAIGLTRNIDFGVSFPVVLQQEISEETQNVIFAENGLTEIRASLKYRFTKIKDWRGAFILSLNQNQIENNPYAGQEAGNTINAELAFGKKIRSYDIAFNFGYRFRNSGKAIPNSIIQPLEDQFIGSLGLSKRLKNSKASIIGELLTSIPTAVNGRTPKSELSSYEALIGLKYNHRKRVASHLGVGFGLVPDTASPDWRVYGGLNWSFGPLWKKSRSKNRRKYKAKKHKHRHSHKQDDGTIITHSHTHTHFKRTSHSRKALADHSHSDPDSFENHGKKKWKPVKHSHSHSHIKDDGTVVTHSHEHSHFEKASHTQQALGDHYHSEPDSFENHYEQAKPKFKEAKRYRLENLNFRSSSHKFNKSIGATLKKFLIFLKRKRNTINHLVVEGHTDSSGDRYKNQALSLRRAKEVKRLIVKFTGISSDIIETTGKGQSIPIATNETPQGRRENRRVEVYVSE